MHRFNITYAVITTESAEHGDFAEQGFEYEGETLEEAYSDLRMEGYAEHAETDGRGRVRWLEFPSTENYQTGDVRWLSLHIPNTVTPATSRRIARLFGYSRPIWKGPQQ